MKLSLKFVLALAPLIPFTGAGCNFFLPSVIEQIRSMSPVEIQTILVRVSKPCSCTPERAEVWRKKLEYDSTSSVNVSLIEEKTWDLALLLREDKGITLLQRSCDGTPLEFYVSDEKKEYCIDLRPSQEFQLDITNYPEPGHPGNEQPRIAPSVLEDAMVVSIPALNEFQFVLSRESRDSGCFSARSKVVVYNLRAFPVQDANKYPFLYRIRDEP